MSYSHTDQEEWEAVQVFLKKWGRPMVVILLSCSVGYLGFDFWQSRQEQHQEQASLQFMALLNALESASEPQAEVASRTKLIQEKYGDTVYADAVALLSARLLVEAHDYSGAVAQLRNVSEHSVRVPMKQLAKSRWLRILMEEKKWAEAEQVWLTLSEAPAYRSLKEELRGDWFAQQGRFEEAKQSYEAAIKAGPAELSERPWLQMKLESVL